MKPDKFQCRLETISEMKALAGYLLERVYDIDHRCYLSLSLKRTSVPTRYLTAYDEFIKSVNEVHEIVDQLKNNLAVFPIVPYRFRLEISSVVRRAELLMRKYEDLD